MSGHSHWSSIKHKKSAVDAKRGKLFSKLAKSIAAAVRGAGADPDTNLRLRYAIDAARAVSMPSDSIKRAIAKASGDDGGARFEEVLFEGYGPGGVAVLINSLTDNRNRTVPELRKMFETNGGNMGQSGSVNWMFKTIGLIVVEKQKVDEDTITMAALDGGADDVSAEGDVWEVVCSPHDFEKVKTAIEKAGIAFANAEITRVATTEISVTPAIARKCMAMINAFEDHDDVQNVYTNMKLTAEVIAELNKDEE